MRGFTIKVPIHLETGVRKKRKHYLNMNIMRNIPFHLNNSLKREMKRLVLPLIPDEYRTAAFARYTLDYELFIPNRLKRDVANICSVIDKFVCDALVEGGVMVDDNYQHLQHITYRYGGYDEDRKGYVLVTIKEVNEEDMLEV